MTGSYSKQTLEAIVQSATDAIITADALGNIVTWNPAAAAMFGHSADEAIGQPLTLVVPQRFQEAHESGIARVASGGEMHIIGTTVRVAGVRKDGTEFPVELSLATWLTDGERFFSGILRDVTEQAELSKRLSSSQQRLEAILNSANDAIVSVDAKGEVVLWNTHAAELFGYSDEEMIGETLLALIPERFREAHVAGIQRVVEGGERHVIGQTVELAALHSDGREFPMELSLATWTSDEERLFVGIIRDITERKKAEEALHLANKSLNQKNEQLEALSGKLAKYLSRQVYDSIFAGKDVKVESYRKELTVFFSDIQGFTDLTDRLEAEPLSELLNSYLSEMAKIADQHGGTIDKFIGDGIMIFFGDPETKGRKADALACVRMGLAMRDHIIELRKGWADLVGGTTSLHVRMGINTGFCTVGNFGSEERLDYTIVGGPVNVASRLESTAEADQIHITHETYSLVKDEIYCRPTGDIKVKGVAHELRTYEVISPLDEYRDGALPINAEASGFNLQFDPSAITTQDTEAARDALRAALTALEGDVD
ncbi:MAG: PAS domain S-box protein [Acidimicrobiia bacterium]